MRKYLLFAILFSLFFVPLLSLARPTLPVQNNSSFSPPSSCINITVNLSQGSTDSSTGGAVSLLQIFLNTKGYLSSQPTGYFGSMTTQAVVNFQKANGLSAVGTVGPQTRDKINALTCGSMNTSSAQSSTNSAQSTNNINYNTTDLGKWIDARSQGSYYAAFPSFLRDDSGKLNISYCSSGEDFNPNFAPDWRNTTAYTTDKVRYQSSTNNGATWSSASTLVSAYRQNNQDNLDQGACTNSAIYYQGRYYLYFESYQHDTGMIAIFVARSDSLAGPYDIYTYDGWQRNPTQSVWKPVLRPSVYDIPGGIAWAAQFKNLNNGIGNVYWGAGIPKITQKDGRLYLYYVDTTYFLIWADSQGVHQYPGVGSPPYTGIPYQLVSISNDPVNFSNVYANKMVEQGGSDIWSELRPKYFPATQEFMAFYFKRADNNNELVSRSSSNGIAWSGEKVSSLNFTQNDPLDSGGQGNIVTINPSITILSNKDGQASMPDLYGIFWKRFILPNAPVGWRDTPNYKWYYGGYDIYGIKISPILNPPSPPPPPSVTTPLVINLTNRYSSADSASGFYVCGTGFKDNIYASVIWTKPDGTVMNGPNDVIWYTKNSQAPFSIASYIDSASSVKKQCAFISLDAALQSSTFSGGWKASFTLYNADNNLHTTVDITPPGLTNNPKNT